jgi:hypothetical protein
MKIFGRGGERDWRYPNPWDCTASSIVVASTAKKKGF